MDSNTMNDLPSQTSLEDLRRDALAHYDELSTKSHHWSSVIPLAINYYFDSRIEERDSSAREERQISKQALTTQDLENLGWEYFCDVTQSMKIYEFQTSLEYYYLFFDETNPSMISIHRAGDTRAKDKVNVARSPQVFRGMLIANYPYSEFEVIMKQVMF